MQEYYETGIFAGPFWEYANKILYAIFDAQRAINRFSVETGAEDFNKVRSYLELAQAELNQAVKEKEGAND